MNKKGFITELREIIQSSNLNFLIGSGTSQPFLPVLNDIETNINEAIKTNDLELQVAGYKRYFKEIMLPNKKIISGALDTSPITDDKGRKLINSNGIARSQKVDFQDTIQAYNQFVKVVASLIAERESTILSKQVNIFTTNIDPFFEKTFEDLSLDYNDGFSGRLNPIFSLSNFKKSTYQRSLHYDHKSEIPVFNLIKVHGSLTWQYENPKLHDQIQLSADLRHFDESLLDEEGENYIKSYKKKVLVVNPEDAKFAETVLNKYYYELLRSYSSEMERANTVLIVIGFSMNDQHIREITQRAATSNPTLRILVFSHSNEKRLEFEEKMAVSKHPNITIVPNKFNDIEEAYEYNLETIAREILESINTKKMGE